MRKPTKLVKIGKMSIGANQPIAIQSMTNVPTAHIAKTVSQIKQLTTAGCDIVRVAVPNREAASAIQAIVSQIEIPIVGDIHFDYRLAIEAMKNGVDKIRINPGNIGSQRKVEEVVAVAKDKNIPIRIGINSGSLEKDILEKYGKPSAEAMIESAKRHIAYLEACHYDNIVISLKASSVMRTIRAYEMFSSLYDYPLHLGVTEAGLPRTATVKSALGMGALLLQGIGDTLRVSITGNPLEEIYVASDILQALCLENPNKPKIQFISCPTCGRTEIDLEGIAQTIYDRIKDIRKPLTVAVMGCVVNGPGEAREADIGVAGGKDKGVIFKKGEIVSTVSADKIVDTIVEEVMHYEDTDEQSL